MQMAERGVELKRIIENFAFGPLSSKNHCAVTGYHAMQAPCTLSLR